MYISGKCVVVMVTDVYEVLSINVIMMVMMLCVSVYMHRFEDPISDPNATFSAGVIIQDFQIQSTNDKWEPTFVSREEEKKKSKGKMPAIYKKVCMYVYVWLHRLPSCDY